MTQETIDRINNVICFGFGCVICAATLLGALGVDLSVSDNTEQSCEFRKSNDTPCVAR